MDVSQYLDIFIDETNGHIQALNDNIMILEKEPENKDVINEIFRAAHSLKGMAGTMGFKKMQRLTHDMENVFQEIRNDNIKVNSNLIDILFSCLDAIEEYLETVKATSDEKVHLMQPLLWQVQPWSLLLPLPVLLWHRRLSNHLTAGSGLRCRCLPHPK